MSAERDVQQVPAQYVRATERRDGDSLATLFNAWPSQGKVRLTRDSESASIFRNKEMQRDYQSANVVGR